MNRYLKEIGTLCGIEKTLTTHVRRHYPNSFPLKTNDLQKNCFLIGNDLETSEVPYLTLFCIKSKERWLQMQKVALFFEIQTVIEDEIPVYERILFFY